LFKALAILSSFSILTRALGFLFRVFLSRMIGAEGLGVYQVAFSVFMVLETFVSSGLPLVVSKQTSASIVKKDKKSEFSTVSSALLIGIITSLLVCLIVYVFKSLFALLFTDTRCIVILLILLPTLVFSSVYAILRGNLWGHKNYFLVSFTEFIEQVVRIIFTVVFLAVLSFSLEKVFLASISYVISCIFSSALVFVLYRKNGGKFSSPKTNMKQMLKESTPITLVRVISSLLMPLISVIIPLQLVSLGYTNDQAMTIFGVAMGMTFPILYIPSTLVGSLSVTLIPELSSAVWAQNFDEIKSKINFSVKFAIFVSFIFIPLFFSLGTPIGVFFYDNADAGYFLTNSCFLILPICLSGVTVSCLNALNLEVKSFINYIVGAVFLVLSVLIFTQFIGIFSLVMGLTICLGGATILNILVLNKKFSTNFFNFKYLFFCFLSAVPALLISKWLFGVVNNFLPLFFGLALSSVAGLVFFLLSALVFNVISLSVLRQKCFLKKSISK
jgi:stage V sporulation protein B